MLTKQQIEDFCKNPEPSKEFNLLITEHSTGLSRNFEYLCPPSQIMHWAGGWYEKFNKPGYTLKLTDEHAEIVSVHENGKQIVF